MTHQDPVATAAPPAPAPGGATTVAARAVPVAVPRDLPAVAGPEEYSFAAAPAAPAATAAPARAAVPLALLWAATALAVLVLSAFLVLVVSGRVVTEGPVVLVLTASHGVHAGDLWALGAWFLAGGALVGAAAATTLAARR